jgi:hypothetical protein
VIRHARRRPAVRRACGVLVGAGWLLAAMPCVALTPLVHPAQEGEAETLLGFAVAVRDGYIAAAAPHTTVDGHVHAGAVHLFAAADGRVLRTLHSPAPAADANFGYAVAIDDHYVLVGAPRASPDGVPLAGAAYLFDRDAGALLRQWHESPPRPHHELGLTVALDRGRAVIGSPGAPAGGVPHAGRAYVFSVATGALLHRLAAESPRAGEGFAHALALSGRLLAVGAPLATVGDRERAGRVDVFDSRTGVRLGRMEGDPAVAGARFGFALAVTGPTVVVGAPGADEGHGPPGHAQVRQGRSGARLHTLRPPPATPARQLFGYAVALATDTVLVGAPDAAPAEQVKAGAVYAFDVATGTVRSALHEPAPTPRSQFGVALATARRVAAIGAQRARLTSGGGAVYLHRR